jgi:arylsulfatase A-like enzyme
MKQTMTKLKYLALASGLALGVLASAQAADKKPNIILMVSDDFGYGDAGVYGGGIGRGSPTPALDKMANEGMTFFDFYGQPSCTPGRAAMMTGRFPNRSGMTTVAFQGQGGGLPKAEWTVASQLKTAGYKTYFTGKWHLGEADWAMPNAHGFDVMKYCGLYHLNAWTYGDTNWFPSMPDDLREMFQKVTKGMLSGNAGETAHEDFKVNGEYVDTPEKGLVGIPYVDAYVEKAALEMLDDAAKTPDKPFFMNINWMKVHQPNMPHPDFIHKSLAKSKFADSIVENDTRIGHVMAKLHELGLDKGNTLVFWTTDNGAWQDVYPDSGYTPFRGTKGTDREGGNRVPAIAWMPGKVAANSKNYDIVGGLDFMATFSAMAGLKLPEKDLEGQPEVFDSYDISPVLFGTGPDPRETWCYFTENELAPGAVRWHQFKFVFNLRGDGGQQTGGLAVDSNLGWKGPEKYVATAPQIFDLYQDPQERYDILMNSFTESTWVAPIMGSEIQRVMKTFLQYPPRKQQSDSYSGPITISAFEKFSWLREQLQKDGMKLTMPTGN